MDNYENPFNDDFNDGQSSTRRPRRGISCGQIASLLSLLVAILAFLFGDNILSRINSGQMPVTQGDYAIETIHPTTESSGDYVVVINGLVWEHSLDESNIYHVNMLTNEPLSNFDIEVTVKFEDEQNEFHGVIFRRTDEDHFYGFQITPPGKYTIYREEETSISNLVGPNYSDSLLLGRGQSNKLRVVAIGSGFKFYINDNLVASLTDTVLSSGDIGLYTCTCNGSENSSVSFYDLTISALP